MDTKYCGKCHTEKSLSAFNKAKQAKDGHYAYCRECVKAYTEERGYNLYKYDASSHRKRQQRCRKTERNQQYERQFRRTYLHTMSGKISKLLASCRGRAVTKGYKYSLTREWLEERLKPLVCEVTGVALTLEPTKTQQHGNFAPSIDRVDNDKGYTPDNCKVVCVMYNKAKSDGLAEDVLLMAKSMVKLHGN